MRHEVHTEINIDAPPEIVWEVLTDLDAYADWNPFITSSAGKPEIGEKLINRLEPPGGRPMTFKPEVTVAEAGKTFEWLGKLAFSGLFDGRHRFEVEAAPNGTRFTQKELFDGVLVRLMRSSLDSQTIAGFEAMNLALKAKVESLAVR